MANKKISEFSFKTPVSADLVFIGDPTTGVAYKTTVGDINGAYGTTDNVTYSSNGTASLSDAGKVIFLSATTNSIVYTINPTTFNKVKVQLYGITSGSYTISVTPSSGTINGNTSYQLLGGECITVYSNGTNLFIVNKN